MAISEYQKWKQAGRPYKEGVAMFLEQSSDRTLIDLFQIEDDYSREILDKELKKRCDNDPPVIPIQPDNIVTESKRPDAFADKALAWLKDIKLKTADLSKKITYNRAQLEHLQNVEKRFELAKAIDQDTERRQELYDLLDYFQEHGKIPDTPEPKEKKEEVPTDGKVLLTREYHNLASRICKARKAKDFNKMQLLIDRRNHLKNELGL